MVLRVRVVVEACDEVRDRAECKVQDARRLVGHDQARSGNRIDSAQHQPGDHVLEHPSTLPRPLSSRDATAPPGAGAATPSHVQHPPAKAPGGVAPGRHVAHPDVADTTPVRLPQPPGPKAGIVRPPGHEHPSPGMPHGIVLEPMERVVESHAESASSMTASPVVWRAGTLWACCFECLADPQDCGFVPGSADHLHSHGQAACEPTGH